MPGFLKLCSKTVNVAKGELYKRFAVKDIILDQQNGLFPLFPKVGHKKVASSSLLFESSEDVAQSLKSVLVLLAQILGAFGPPKKRVKFDKNAKKFTFFKKKLHGFV